MKLLLLLAAGLSNAEAKTAKEWGCEWAAGDAAEAICLSQAEGDELLGRDRMLKFKSLIALQEFMRAQVICKNSTELATKYGLELNAFAVRQPHTQEIVICPGTEK